jgi:hypothetical protein
LEEFKIRVEIRCEIRSCITQEMRREDLFWMMVKGVHPNPFIYFTMYLVDLLYALRT